MKPATLIPILVFAIVISCTNKNHTDNKTKGNTIEQNSKQEAENQGQASITDDISDSNALQVAKSLPDFTTLVTAIETAGVENSVVNVGPLTIFAPTNSAFDKLPSGTLENLVKPGNKEKLAYILKNHVAPANYPDSQLEKEAEKGRKLYMASGEYLNVLKKEDGLYVGDTKILKTVKVSNGWIHVIDDVIIPTNK
ncbi:fasciclin domain-containing protein [Aureibaculum marinum]|uniref:Fasciclin domain-containing protein n=1 Tax=Aureibaculum marinum TaxID=2487930 RepID=A0A3N4P2A2_9FLAO|nr:fasciclin domain-containing protein [Aureibaculum marinum]RPD98720.1 fasciclin domain-containing protein [Aureibaculum marinum]